MPDTPQATTNNPKFDFHKVFAALGVILIVVIIIVAGMWYFSEGRNSATDDDEGDTVKVSTSSAKPATKSASSKTYENKNGRFKIDIPTSWTIKSEPAKNREEEVSQDTFSGAEGSIIIDYNSVGGGCGPSIGEEGKIKTKNAVFDYLLIGQSTEKDTYCLLPDRETAVVIGISSLSINAPKEKNKDKVFSIVKTLEVISSP